MNTPTALAVAWDAWHATRAGSEGIAARQYARFVDLVAFARTHARFYAERYHHLPDSITDLRLLPPVTKPELMARFDDWVTDPAVTRPSVEAFIADLANVGHDYLDRYVVFTTSGSSGVPAILVQDRGALAVAIGVASARSRGVITPHDLWRMLRGGMRIAAIYATGGHFLAYTMLQRRMRQHPIRCRYTRIFSVFTPLPTLVRALNAFQPTLIGSYASALDVLAQEQEAGRLAIHPVMITSGGEWLAPATRTYIARVFGCSILDSYAASEAMPIALPCRHGRLHVNSDWFVLEPVDESYQPVPTGQLSHSLLVTNLANRVQPIIRYDLGDRVIIGAESCACGSPLPTIQVEGRTDEILAFPTSHGEPIQILPMALSTVVEAAPGVSRCQVIQTAPNDLTVRLETSVGADRASVWNDVQRRLHAFFAAQDVAGVRLSLTDERPMLHPVSGKFRHVWSEAGQAAPVLAVAGGNDAQ